MKVLFGNILVFSVRSSVQHKFKKRECIGSCTCEVEMEFQLALGSARSRSSNALHSYFCLLSLSYRFPSKRYRHDRMSINHPRLACSNVSWSTLAHLISWTYPWVSHWGPQRIILIGQSWVIRPFLCLKTIPMAKAWLKPCELCFPTRKEGSIQVKEAKGAEHVCGGETCGVGPDLGSAIVVLELWIRKNSEPRLKL